jgi:xanthine dehydrogenase accessory factor
VADKLTEVDTGRVDSKRTTMDIFEEIVRMRHAGERGAMATSVHTNGSIPSFESSRMLIHEDGSIVGTIGGGCVEAEVWAAGKEVMHAEQPQKMTFNLNHEATFDAGLICGGTLEIFVEPIVPPSTLYIFGGGDVSSAVARVAWSVDFAIDVIDDRKDYVISGLFPMAADAYTSFQRPASSIY